jgi:ribosomal protein S18 acetylase RimI-like enzyme
MSRATLRPAGAGDLPAVAALMNRAYRGAGAQAGWSHEAGLLGGQRTDETMLRDDLARPGARLLLWEPEGRLSGCVFLEDRGDTWYLGGLTVDPDDQAGGIGRCILDQAEAAVRAGGGTAIRMTVIQLRDTLIAWYGRRGYRPTGETAPFPYGDTRFGVPLRPDLHFVVLEKRL